MRVGEIVKVLPEKKIGFIRSEDLDEDVFFHFSKVQKVGTLDLQQGDEVEYEIDELHRIEKIRLQATMVRRSVRPLTLRLAPSDAPDLNAHHHPKARRRRPSWRDSNAAANDEPPTDSDADSGGPATQ
jgi:cold shock CspA family protein